MAYGQTERLSYLPEKTKPMTIDERLEFLLRSTESLHASVSELHAVAQEQTRRAQEQTKQLEEHTTQLRIDAENIRGLARIAEAHEQRISDSEDGPTDE